jgi:hypothetical protein
VKGRHSLASRGSAALARNQTECIEKRTAEEPKSYMYRLGMHEPKSVLACM